MTEWQQTRRRFLLAGGSATAVGLAGCTGLLGDGEAEITDSDGDGVIDSEDYAPRDPDVQRKEQLVDEECPSETDTPSSNGGAENGEVSLDFDDPPEAFDGYTETIDGDRKLVLRGQEVEYEIADVSDWERIEYSVMGQGAGNTHITIQSAEDGRYTSFVGIRPWMRWNTAVEGFDGANTYPDVDWEGAEVDTEYRVLIERTGGATGRLTVRDAGGETLYELGTETIFDVHSNVSDATFVPSTLTFSSNKQSERAVFDDVVIR